MSHDVPVECPDLCGKTIQTLKIFRDLADGTEIQIDFTDGSSFVCCVETRTKVEASLLVCGTGEPKILSKYDFN